jgi:mRNA interferase MazF
MEIKQYSIYWVNLDPIVGSEISKTRPCVVVSPNEMNKYLKTVMIAPLTHTLKPYPTRVLCKINEQAGMVMLDQIRTVDKIRLTSYLGKLNKKGYENIKATINEMLC